MSQNKQNVNPLGVEQRLRDLQHFGEEGGVVPSIDHASTSTFLNPKDMGKVFSGEREGCYLYSRHTNPTTNMFASKMAVIEKTESAVATASGMSAISCVLEQLYLRCYREKNERFKSGGHVICSDTVYGGTYALLAHLFPARGIDVSFVDIHNLEQVQGAIRKNTYALYTESMSNPLLKVADLRALSAIAQREGLFFVVDNTFTPLMITPKDWGADVIVHSCTKFISGASDLIAGVVCCDSALARELIDLNWGSVMLNGPVLDAHLAYQLYSRLDHLPLRMKAHSESAKKLVEGLVGLGLGDRLVYPGLKSHPHHELLKTLFQSDFGFGAMLTFDCGTQEKAVIFAEKLQNNKFGLFAVSLGFSRTLMSCPASSTSSEIPQDSREQIGLSEGLLRLSIGFIGENDVMLDRFHQAYQEIFHS